MADSGGDTGRPFYWLDVFSDRQLAGNGLAVVLDADGVTPETMLAFAREVGLSETTFVQSPDAPAPDAPAGDPEPGGIEGPADYRSRIWTVTAEIPFAGHPSLGTAVAVAIERGLDRAGFVQQTGVGLQKVDATLDDGGWRASMRQPPAEFGPVVRPEAIAPALGLATDRIDHELSAQIVSTGLPAILVPLRDVDALGDCEPDFGLVAGIDPRPAMNTYAFVYERGSRTVRARCFGADLAGNEDPATGSAAGPLVAYLQDCLDIDSVVIEQGVEMGRPSRIEARMADGRPEIAGNVTPLARGRVDLPD